MKTVLIGCRLPHGLSFTGQSGNVIKLNGMNTSLVEGGHGLTHVDADDAAVFFVTHSEFAPVKSGAVFTHQTADAASIHDMAQEIKGERTGFEGLDPAAPIAGLKPEDKQVMKVAPQPPKPVTAKADKAARAAAAQLAGA